MRIRCLLRDETGIDLLSLQVGGRSLEYYCVIILRKPNRLYTILLHKSSRVNRVKQTSYSSLNVTAVLGGAILSGLFKSHFIDVELVSSTRFIPEDFCN